MEDPVQILTSVRVTHVRTDVRTQLGITDVSAILQGGLWTLQINTYANVSSQVKNWN